MILLILTNFGFVVLWIRNNFITFIVLLSIGAILK